MHAETVVDRVVQGAGATSRADLEHVTSHHRAALRETKLSLTWLKAATRCLLKRIFEPYGITQHYAVSRLKNKFKMLLLQTYPVAVKNLKHKTILLNLVSIWVQDRHTEEEDVQLAEQTEQAEQVEQAVKIGSQNIHVCVKTGQGELILDIQLA